MTTIDCIPYTKPSITDLEIRYAVVAVISKYGVKV